MGDKCIDCGKPLTNPRYNRCYDCEQKKRGTTGGGSGHGGSFEPLPEGYLSKGYFDENGDLRPELVIGSAESVAKAFGSKFPNHQLRRYYNHAKEIETRLETGTPFHALLPDILKLIPFVSEAKGKNKVPDSFFNFIKKNIELVKDEKAFVKGFMVHFEAVVAYFTYIYPRA
jgi:CRISPR-associated protein Csm2